MEPTLSDGDVVLCNAVSDELSVGEAILFARPHALVVHRVVGIAGDTILERGDANILPRGVHRSDVQGRVRFVLKRGEADASGSRLEAVPAAPTPCPRWLVAFSYVTSWSSARLPRTGVSRRAAAGLYRPLRAFLRKLARRAD